MAVDQRLPPGAHGESRPDESQNWLGLTALITGILGLGPVALTFGVLGLRASTARRATNRGMALAGVILGAIGIAFWLVTIVLLVGLLSVRGTTTTSSDPVAAGPAPVVDPAEATRFVLAPDASSDPALLDAAAAYLGSRVDADISVEDGTIVVDFGDTAAGPGIEGALTAPSGAQFRPVVATASPSPGVPSAWPAPVGAPSWAGDPAYYAAGDLGAGFDAIDCTDPAQRITDVADVDAGAVACDVDGGAKYLLGPAVLTADDIGGVNANGPTLSLKFDDEGAAVFSILTAKLVEQQAPGNQIALLADGTILSAPSVATPVVGGAIEMSLDDDAAALRLVGALTYGSPLMQLSIQSATT